MPQSTRSQRQTRTLAIPADESNRNRLLLALAAVTLVIALAAAPAWAKSDKAKGNGNQGKGKQSVEKIESNAEQRLEEAVIDGVLDGLFGREDREIIERYYRNNPPNTKRLPPGIAKNVARGKPLPPGIAKQHFPNDLERQLPPLSKEYERILVGDDVTIVRRGTEIIVDILEDVLSQ